jgi:hypothetical protein
LAISIVLPLFDLRDAGLAALRSALNQDIARDRYELIAVVGTGTVRDPELDALLARCDKVVRVAADPRSPESEILYYMAGYAQTSGDLLFFTEGHAVLKPHCCTTIDSYFSSHPDIAVAWAPRINRSRSRLARIIGSINLRAEALADKQGWFSLGANSVIKKSLFVKLGGFEPGYYRLNENALFECMRAQGVVCGKIDTALAVHHNDMSRGIWIGLARLGGTAKFNWCTAEAKAGLTQGPAHRRYRLYGYFGHRPTARLWSALFNLIGHGALFLAIALEPIAHQAACALYTAAARSFSAAGYCKASVDAALADGAEAQSHRAASGHSRTSGR